VLQIVGGDATNDGQSCFQRRVVLLLLEIMIYDFFAATSTTLLNICIIFVTTIL
jgi:hypothetical protein